MSFGVGVGDIFAVLGLVKDLRRRLIDAPEQFASISRGVKTLSSTLDDVGDTISELDLGPPQEKRIKEVTEDCEALLNELQRELDKYQELGQPNGSNGVRAKVCRTWKRARWDQEEIDVYQRRITLSIGAFNSLLGQINLLASSGIKSGVNNIEERLIDREEERRRHEERKAVLAWLTRDNDYAVQHRSQHADFYDRLCDGTGQWLLDSDEFTKWTKEDGGVLFCAGGPGVGKTMLAARAIDHLHTKGGLSIAFLYCNYRRQQEQKPVHLFTALLQQFLPDEPQPVPKELVELYERHKRKSTHASLKDISEVLQEIISGYHSRSFIFIDALDELQAERDIFINELLDMKNKIGANIFLTSRPIPDIESHFEDDTETKKIEIYARPEDVHRYLDENMSMLPKFVSRNPQLIEEIKLEISNAVNGMFLLAHLYLVSLAEKKKPAALKGALQKFKERKGVNMYDMAYTEAMERIEGAGAESVELAKQVLSWMTCASRPLTVMELRNALVVEIDDADDDGDDGEEEDDDESDDGGQTTTFKGPGGAIYDEEELPDIEDAVAVCHGLVTVDQNTNVVRFVHYTTQEFFERAEVQTRWFPNPQRKLAVTCAIYLSSDCVARRLSKNDILRGNELERRSDLNQLYDYACENWESHTVKSGAEKEPAVAKFLRSERQVLASLQAYAYKLRGTILEEKPSFLRFAMLCGWDLTAIHMIENQNDINAITDDTGDAETALHLAARWGRLAVVLRLLSQKDIKPDTLDHEGYTPLCRAAACGHGEIVKALCERKDVNPNRKVQGGKTPLHLAAGGAYPLAVRALLRGREDLDPNILDEYGHPALLEAIRIAGWTLRMKVVPEILADKRVNVNHSHDGNKTALLSAMYRQHSELIEQLLKRRDLDINRRYQPNNDTALTLAAFQQWERTVELLLDVPGIDVNSQSGRGGNTALHLAVSHQNYNLTRIILLFGKGIDVNSKNDDSETPLITNTATRKIPRHPIDKREYHMILQALLDAGADPNIPDIHGKTALRNAIESGTVTTVEKLLATGGLNHVDKDGRTSLHHVAQLNPNITGTATAKADLILGVSGLDINAKDKEGCTALHRAAEFKNPRIVWKLLAVKGIDVNARDKKGGTPLHACASTSPGKTSITVAKHLLHAGADPKITDEDGLTPYDVVQKTLTEKGNGSLTISAQDYCKIFKPS